MAAYYLDSSGLAKRYVAEPGSAWIQRLTDPGAGHFIFTVSVTGPEIIAAIVRRARGGHLPQTDARQAVTNIRLDWRTLLIVVAVDGDTISCAMNIAESHGLRGYDAVHVAAAQQLQADRQSRGLPTLTFVSADLEQLAAAASEGLPVEDPNQHH